MDRVKYKELINKYNVKENRLYNALLALLAGGTLGVLGQLLIDIYTLVLNIPTQDAQIFMSITLVFLGCLLTAIGVFDKLVALFKCGLIIPSTGFAHSMMSSTMEYKREGLVTGMGANMFKLAGTVIMMGVVSAYFFGILRWIFLGG